MTEISKTIVVVLIIATIFVSVISTWIVLNTVNEGIAKKLSMDKSYGQVSVNIVPPDATTDSGSGQVTVNIQKR